MVAGHHFTLPRKDDTASSPLNTAIKTGEQLTALAAETKRADTIGLPQSQAIMQKAAHAVSQTDRLSQSHKQLTPANNDQGSRQYQQYGLGIDSCAEVDTKLCPE